MKSEDTRSTEARALALRRAFDQTFAEAPAEVTASTQAFLAVGVGGDNYALRLAEVAELYADKKVVPVPSQSADLLGIASFRGSLVAVYDLRILLGYPVGLPPRWLILTARDRSIGLALDQLDGYLNLPSEAVAPATAKERAPQYLSETLSASEIVRPIISITAILDAIKRRTASNK
ncbi:MAG TPA: chemotaxis protein CheW [Phototrophicaceae bacterium]|nr:chemotaxis protein CheW [Phototrophicaceae bacterium]